MKKNFLYGSLIATSLIFAGCGSSDTAIQDSTTDITVERGPVIGAYVVDANAKRAINLGNGQYRFISTPTYPITAYGGYIDVNRDGIIDGNDTTLTMPLSLSQQNRTKLTILTTLASSNDTLKTELLNSYGLSEEELFTLTPSTSLKVSAISDIVFKYCIENNSSVTDMNLTTLQSIRTDIETLITANENSTQTILETVTANEIVLIDDLNITLEDTDANMTIVSNTVTQSTLQTQDPTILLASLPIAELTDEQKEGLVFMYQEEKVARDVYTKMYEKWGTKVFLNISKSEQTHMDSVRAILEKYDLEVPVASDTIGIFELEELQNLYNTLITMGNVSSNEAMKVGVLVEETDIADLIERMNDAPEDIRVVYQSLLNGSYNHLNAFSKQVY
ncbi:MAG: DUF2202 domain-containing protein [Arcobacteraceae bacterium]|nr:DUF2202 domain-containing protein [Arcobacteraceae bacterium]